MFYKITPDAITEIALGDIKNSDVIAGYIKLPELDDVAKQFELSPIAVNDCRADASVNGAAIDVYDDFSFGVINIINLQKPTSKRDRVAMFLKKNLFIMVEILDEDTSTADMFSSAIKRYTSKITLEKVIYGIMDRLIAGGNARLAETQKTILKLENRITNNKLDADTNKVLFSMKKSLTLQKEYFDQLVDVGAAFEDNENDLFSSDNLRYFGVFTAKADRLSAQAGTLCENLVHVREAYEAGINYNMNRTMQFFTIITTIFLPLTLIVGWFGMNFTHMPLLTSRYGYPAIIILSIVIVIANIVWFKKKKYM